MKHDYQKEFRDFLKKSRENVGLTQQKAADRINISIQGFQKWESGESLPSQGYYDAIMQTYNLDRKIFFEKLNNAQCPPPEIEEKERKYPWPDCMPLETWLQSSVFEQLKNLQLNEVETELLGLEEIYSFKGTIDFNTTKLINAINGNIEEDQKYNMLGKIDFSGIPYEFIKTHGVFNVNNAKNKIHNGIFPESLKGIILSHFMYHPNNKTFDICDLTPRDFYDYSFYIPVRTRKASKDLFTLLNNVKEILYSLEKYNNKYCLFNGSEFTEFEYKDNKWSYKDNIVCLFESTLLYDTHLPAYSTHRIEECTELIYCEPLQLYKDLLEVVKEPITDNIEYLEYQNKLEFYEKNKDKGAVKPQEPTEMGLYVVPTEKGKELLKWFKEIGILKD